MNAAKESIRKGSKSFFLASLFFPAYVKRDCWSLYSWCRHCDDEIDNAPPELLFEKLKTLEENTFSKSASPASPVLFKDFATVCERYEIPAKYPRDMLAGFAMDTESFKFETLAQVELYGYRVAGVVGLMMSHIMGLSEERALGHAVKLGIAMQLTNIARDVHEDHLRNRLYIPLEWLTEHNVTKDELFRNPELLYNLVMRLLDRSEELYSEGLKGLPYLPIRAAWAVAIASYIYAAIGKKIRQNGPTGLLKRTVISLPEKLYWVVVGTKEIIPLMASRVLRKWKPLPSIGEYNYELRN